MDQPKPQSFMDSLGPQVEMSSKKMDPYPWAQDTLREIGKQMVMKETQSGMEYVGSFAFHIVRTSQDHGRLTGTWDMASVTQVAIDSDCSEQLAQLAFNNGVLQLRRWFNPDVKTGRRGDGR